MAYSKLAKVCQDYPLGYQDINQAIDNNAAIRDLWDVRHGLLEPASGAGGGRLPWTVAGRHDDFFVPRSVALVEVGSSGGVIFGEMTVDGDAFGDIVRISTGKWILNINNLTAWWAVAQCMGGTTTQRRLNLHRSVPTTGQHALYISTYELSSGAFVETDIDFSVSVFGTLA